MNKQKEVFTIKIEDKDIELAAIKPTVQIQMDAQKYYNKAFSEALQFGALLKIALTNYMKKQNLWDDEKQKEHDRLVNVINDGEKTLSRGKIRLSEAKKIALDMRLARIQLRILLSNMTELYPSTAEGQADSARFNYLVAACTVYNNTGERFYKNVDEFLEKQEESAAILAVTNFSKLYYDLGNNSQELDLPENKFLIKYKFVNEKLQLVNDKGELVDTEGKRIDEFGYYIDSDGSRIDGDGNQLDENGFYKLETSPFLDDDGNPIDG